MSDKPLPISGSKAYRSEEFQAFCKRFGIPWELRTRTLTLTFTEGTLEVNQQYLVFEVEEQSNAVDTTTLQNDKYRTFSPSRGEGVVN